MKLIYRTVDGLLYGKSTTSYFPNTFVTEDWVVPSINTTLSISSSRLRIQINSNNVNPGIIKNLNVASQTKVLVYTVMQCTTGTSRIGPVVHVGNNDVSNADGISLDLPINQSATLCLLREWNSGSYVLLDSTTPYSGSVSTLYPFWLLADGTTVIGSDTITSRNWSGSASTRSSGYVGVWATTHDIIVYVTSFFAQKDRYITISGLIPGDSIELRDSSNSVITSASESGGSASIDIYDQEIQTCDRLVLVRSSVDYAQYTIGPEIYISGGDTYLVDENVTIAENAVTANTSRYIDYNGNIYFGSISAHGEIKVSQFNKITKVVTTTSLETVSDGDLHYCPNIMVDSSGYIWVSYSLHNENNYIYYYKSSNIEDISTFGSKQSIGPFSNTNSYCYIFQRSDGRIILFTRVNSITNDQWGVAWSDNGGASWTVRSWLGTSTWLYIKPTQSTLYPDIINISIHWSTSSGAYHDIRIATVDLSDGNVTIPGGGSIGNLYSGGLVDPTNGLLVYSSTASSYAWGDDVNEFGEVFFTTFDPADPDNTGMYNYVKVESDGTVGTIDSFVATGSPTISGYAWGRGNFAGEGIICLVRESAGEWLVETYRLFNGSWFVTRLDIDPNGGLDLRRYPITSSTYNTINSYIIYNRQKSMSPTTYISSNDLVIAPLNVLMSKIVINGEFKSILDVYIHNGTEFKQVINKYILMGSDWKNIL